MLTKNKLEIYLNFKEIKALITLQHMLKGAPYIHLTVQQRCSYAENIFPKK